MPPIPSPRQLPPILFVLLALGLLAAVVFWVDLSPRVEGDFFFATDDPQLQDSAAIAERFPQSPQILVAAEPASPGDPATGVRSTDYLETVGRLSAALAEVPGVTGVRSIAQGPPTPRATWESPLWRRLLLPEPAEEATASYLLVSSTPETGRGGAATRELVEGVEAVLDRFAAADRLTLHASGVPWVMELIRRHLVRDLALFSLVGLALFTLVVALLYRSARVVVGVLTACLSACALTLLLLALFDVPVGVLTANIATIVFVLTLSHLVYLTANHRASTAADGDERAREAVGSTRLPSFWSMATTLVGFASLQLADARPLRELGTAGALGAAVAFAVAYLVYPAFLRGAHRTADGAGAHPGASGADPFGGRRLSGWTVALGVVVVAAAPGLAGVETDPPLTSYFAPGSEIAAGLETIDRGSGSSPLVLLVESADDPEARFDQPQLFQRLTRAVAALEAEPATGAVLALPALVEEANRQNPFAAFTPLPAVVDALASETAGGVARSFLSEDRTETLVVVRMRETARLGPDTPSRRATMERLEAALAAEGLETVRRGGLYPLQAALGELVARSLVTGLLALGLLFVGVAFAVSRALRPSFAMLACLAATPVVLYGTLGWLRAPVDLIASPAANVAVAMGIDSMIHLVTAVRRLRRQGLGSWEAWVAARARLWRPIVGAAALLAAGFGIFALSSFPPTQRFGLAVVLGLAVATVATLVALPRLGSPGAGEARDG